MHEGRKTAVHKIMNLVAECLVLPRSKQPAVIHKRVMQGETTPENPHRQDKSSYHFEKPLSPHRLLTMMLNIIVEWSAGRPVKAF